MSTLHAKCPRCGAVGQHYGGRRRRCRQCGRTWTIRPKRRGPAPRRIRSDLPDKLLSGKTTTAQLAKSCRCSATTVRRHCRRACRTLVGAGGLPRLPATGTSTLALIVDGMWCRFRHRHWVLYCMAVKPTDASTAFFLDPVLIQGPENGANWALALATLPPAVAARVRALVTDGFGGHKREARGRGWLVQRCHRHLDAILWGVYARRKRRLRGGKIRKAIYDAVVEIRSTADLRRVAELGLALRRYARHPDLTDRIRGVVRRLLHDLASFRTYLDYPELNLPTTTNAVESRNNLMREVLSCVNNPTAALLRARAYTRLHPSITCNSHENQQKPCLHPQVAD